MVDLVVVFETSDSDGISTLKRITKDLLNELNVGTNGVRVAVMTHCKNITTTVSSVVWPGDASIKISWKKRCILRTILMQTFMWGNNAYGYNFFLFVNEHLTFGPAVSTGRTFHQCHYPRSNSLINLIL